jgi:hypothetical protein
MSADNAYNPASNFVTNSNSNSTASYHGRNPLSHSSTNHYYRSGSYHAHKRNHVSYYSYAGQSNNGHVYRTAIMNHNMCPRGQSSASTSTLVPITPALAQSSFSLAIDDWLPDEEAAKETMREIYGSQLTNDGSKPKRKDGKVVNYGCNVSECMLRVRIRCSKKAGDQYCIEVAQGWKNGKPKYEHTHPDTDGGSDSDSEGKYSRGLPPQFKKFVQDKLEKSSRTTAIECLRALQTKFRDSPIQDLQQRVSVGQQFRHLKTQVRSLVTRFHQKIHGKSLKSTLHYYGQLAHTVLDLPTEYASRDNFKSPRDICDALGLESIESEISFDLSNSEWNYRIKDYAKSPAEWLKWKNDLELSFFVVTPASLYTLLCLVKQRKGSRALYCDGTHGLIATEHKFIVMGPLDVCYRKDMNDVTASLKPCGYLTALEENKATFTASLLAIQYLALYLFGRRFVLDFGESDKTDAFIRP